MNWIVQALTSTLGRKLIMALTGAFLCLFLVVHLSGNLQLLKDDGGESFNKYAEFMGHNPLIQAGYIGNFFFIALHIVTSILLTLRNRKARPVAYAYSKEGKSSAWSSRNMGILGTVILIFLVVHLQNFWFKVKFGVSLPPAAVYDGVEYKDVYTLSKVAFSELWIVVLYLISMVGLAFHLSHGFASMFQSLGLNHKKYNYLIKFASYEFGLLIPAGFACIPLLMFLEVQVPVLFVLGGLGALAVGYGVLLSKTIKTNEATRKEAAI